MVPFLLWWKVALNIFCESCNKEICLPRPEGPQKVLPLETGLEECFHKSKRFVAFGSTFIVGSPVVRR